MEYPESQQNSHALYQIQYAGLHLGAIQRLYEEIFELLENLLSFIEVIFKNES